jgi:hypothetical protein
MNAKLLPAYVSPAIAGRLLGFVPPAGINRDRAAHPELYPTSPSLRRFTMVDVDHHPRRAGKPVTVAELLAADRACDADRAKYRMYNSTRKDGDRASA